MIRQPAFGSAPSSMLKGGLHCHTTRSDGHGTPEEVIRMHAQHGYAFLAITDHRIYNYQNYAPDVEITIVPGMEIDRNLVGGGVHCFHHVSIGPSREDGNGFEQDQEFESGTVKNQFDHQPVLDMLHKNNNMTIYCHPEWSSTPAREFDQIKGNFAMEIWNSGCAIENEMDTNAAYWDELLMQGQKIWGAATDDGHAMSQHCVGWVMVNAENKLNSILTALKNGAFYSSCGPEIYDFYIDNGVAVVECSPCKFINICCGLHPHRMTKDENGLVTRAEMKLPDPFTFKYVRATMVDEQGRRAWTNPIFL